LFHNSKVFGSCIIHILYTGCAKIKKFRREKVKTGTGELVKDRQCTHNATQSPVRATIVAVEKEEVLLILSVRL